MIILIIIFAFVLLTALAAIGICFRFYKKQKKIHSSIIVKDSELKK